MDLDDTGTVAEAQALGISSSLTPQNGILGTTDGSNHQSTTTILPSPLANVPGAHAIRYNKNVLDAWLAQFNDLANTKQGREA